MDKAEIQNLIRQEIEAYLNQKQYAVSKIQNHEHNGMDSNPISAINVKGFLPLPSTDGGVVSDKVLGDEIVIQGDSRNGYGSFATLNKVQIPIYPIPNIMGGGNITPETLTAVVAEGATTAELTSAWTGETQVLTVMFETWLELADVQFTKGDATITWPAPLEFGSSVNISIIGDTLFKGGDAPYGSALTFSIPASEGGDQAILWLRIPVEGSIYKWFGVQLTEVAPEYFNSNNAV